MSHLLDQAAAAAAASSKNQLNQLKPPQRGKYGDRNYAPEEVVHHAALQNVMAVHKTCMMRSGDKAWQQLSLVTFYTCIARYNEDSGPGAFSFL